MTCMWYASSPALFMMMTGVWDSVTAAHEALFMDTLTAHVFSDHHTAINGDEQPRGRTRYCTTAPKTDLSKVVGNHQQL